MDAIKKVVLVPSMNGVGVRVIYVTENCIEEEMNPTMESLDAALKVTQIIQAQALVNQITTQVELMRKQLEQDL